MGLQAFMKDCVLVRSTPPLVNPPLPPTHAVKGNEEGSSRREAQVRLKESESDRDKKEETKPSAGDKIPVAKPPRKAVIYMLKSFQ